MRSPRLSLIQVPRQVVRDCAAELSHLQAWREKPCTSLKTLVYGLNTVVDNYPVHRYRHGLPRPSVIVRDLERIQGLANTAARTANTRALRARIEQLADDDSDSYRLLIYQTARLISPDHPERVAPDPATAEKLLNLAQSDPGTIAKLAERALGNLGSKVQEGAGGDRNKGDFGERELVEDLGHLFMDIAARAPGATFDAGAGEYRGPFLGLVRVMFEYLGLKTGHRHLFELYNDLDSPEWDSPRKNQPRWERKF